MMKNKIYILGILLSLALSGFIILKVDIVERSIAEESKTRVYEEDEYKCVKAVLPYFQEQQVLFLEALQKHFQKEQPNSELMPQAMRMLRLYVAELNTKVGETYKPESEALFLRGQTEQLRKCRVLVGEYEALATKMLSQHAIITAQAKKTGQLEQKYIQINKKLRQIVLDAAEVGGAFERINSNIPCIVEKCQ